MTSGDAGNVAMLRITQVHSRIGNQERVVKVLVDGLGLGRIGSHVVLPNNPYTRGMIAKVAHIVRVEEVADTTTRKAKAVRQTSSSAKARAAKPATGKPAAEAAGATRKARTPKASGDDKPEPAPTGKPRGDES